MARVEDYIPYIAAVGGTILLFTLAKRKEEEEVTPPSPPTPTPPTPPEEKHNYIYGYVKDVNVRVPIKGALVKYGGKATTTDYRGYFKIEDVPTSGYITVEASGYEPYKKYITVPESGGKRIDIYLTSKSGYGAVYFTSYPTGAFIYVDAEYYGSTPLSAVLPAGTHNVQFSKPYYRPAIKNVYIAPYPRKTKIHAILGELSSDMVVRYE